MRCALVAAVLVAAGCAAAGCSAGSRAGSPSAEATGAPSPPATPQAASPAGPRSFTVAATGDVLVHDELWIQARTDAASAHGYDFRPLLADLRPVIRGADLAICHMETPLAPRGGPYEGYPTFASPPQVAGALAWAGYDACSTASNHSLDQGFAGVVRTLEILDHAGIAAYGTSRSAEGAQQPDTVTVEGVRVGLLAYTFGFNGISEPGGKAWIADRIDAAEILADARAATRAGAEVVLVSLHWGDEYQHEITPRQRALAPRLLASPNIDLLLGHHAHVVQPIERIGGEWVAYGLGNQVAAHETPVPANQEGVLTRFTFTEREGRWTVTRAEYVPTYVTDPYPVRLVNVPATLASPGPAPAPRARLEKALGRTTRVVNSRGGAEDGLTMVRPGP